jgi:ECF sigma factor
MSDVTQVLPRVGHGGSQAAEELLPLIYDELRKLAAHRMAHELPGHTLQPTALVHEGLLAANCAQCHQPGGPTPALFDARISTTTANAGLINGPLADTRGNGQNRVLYPGSPALSVMLQRVASRRPGQMPLIGTTVVDTSSVQLLTDWINTDALTFQSFSDWQIAQFGNPQLPQAAADADPDGDGALNYLEFLVGTDPHNSSDAWRIVARISNGAVQIRFPRIARRGFEVQSTASLSNCPTRLHGFLWMCRAIARSFPRRNSKPSLKNLSSALQ